jgi:SAM-dependent methyltransferase
MSSDKAAAFGGSLAEYYDRYLVPMNFAPYADVVAERVAQLRPRRILETAAGTGVLTEALARTVPSDTTITATDLNQAMIDLGKTRPGMARVTWQQADALKLPFDDGAFDLIVCQFGVMFFPDRRVSFRECWRLLSRGGTYLFVVWDGWATQPDAPLGIANRTVGAVLKRDPNTLGSPGYFDETVIRADLAAAGFQAATVERVTRPARAATAREAAVIVVHGSLLRTAIEASDPSRLGEATDAVEAALSARFGPGAVDGQNRALIVTATRV